MMPSLLLALIPLDFGLGRAWQKRLMFRIICYVLNLELLFKRSLFYLFSQRSRNQKGER
jgi:hypothetical protein